MYILVFITHFILDKRKKDEVNKPQMHYRWNDSMPPNIKSQWGIQKLHISASARFVFLQKQFTASKHSCTSKADDNKIRTPGVLPRSQFTADNE